MFTYLLLGSDFFQTEITRCWPRDASSVQFSFNLPEVPQCIEEECDGKTASVKRSLSAEARGLSPALRAATVQGRLDPSATRARKERWTSRPQRPQSYGLLETSATRGRTTETAVIRSVTDVSGKRKEHRDSLRSATCRDVSDKRKDYTDHIRSIRDVSNKRNDHRDHLQSITCRDVSD